MVYYYYYYYCISIRQCSGFGTSFFGTTLLSLLTHLSLPSSSVSLSHFIFAVPMRECLGKHSCMSSLFPIAVLYGTFFSRNDMI